MATLPSLLTDSNSPVSTTASNSKQHNSNVDHGLGSEDSNISKTESQWYQQHNDKQSQSLKTVTESQSESGQNNDIQSNQQSLSDAQQQFQRQQLQYQQSQTQSQNQWQSQSQTQASSSSSVQVIYPKSEGGEINANDGNAGNQGKIHKQTSADQFSPVTDSKQYAGYNAIKQDYIRAMQEGQWSERSLPHSIDSDNHNRDGDIQIQAQNMNDNNNMHQQQYYQQQEVQDFYHQQHQNHIDIEPVERDLNDDDELQSQSGQSGTVCSSTGEMHAINNLGTNSNFNFRQQIRSLKHGDKIWYDQSLRMRGRGAGATARKKQISEKISENPAINHHFTKQGYQNQIQQTNQEMSMTLNGLGYGKASTPESSNSAYQYLAGSSSHKDNHNASADNDQIPQIEALAAAVKRSNQEYNSHTQPYHEIEQQQLDYSASQQYQNYYHGSVDLMNPNKDNEIQNQNHGNIEGLQSISEGQCESQGQQQQYELQQPQAQSQNYNYDNDYTQYSQTQTSQSQGLDTVQSQTHVIHGYCTTIYDSNTGQHQQYYIVTQNANEAQALQQQQQLNPNDKLNSDVNGNSAQITAVNTTQDQVAVQGQPVIDTQYVTSNAQNVQQQPQQYYIDINTQGVQSSQQIYQYHHPTVSGQYLTYGSQQIQSQPPVLANASPAQVSYYQVVDQTTGQIWYYTNNNSTDWAQSQIQSQVQPYQQYQQYGPAAASQMNPGLYVQQPGVVYYWQEGGITLSQPIHGMGATVNPDSTVVQGQQQSLQTSLSQAQPKCSGQSDPATDIRCQNQNAITAGSTILSDHQGRVSTIGINRDITDESQSDTTSHSNADSSYSKVSSSAYSSINPQYFKPTFGNFKTESAYSGRRARRGRAERAEMKILREDYSYSYTQQLQGNRVLLTGKKVSSNPLLTPIDHGGRLLDNSNSNGINGQGPEASGNFSNIQNTAAAGILDINQDAAEPPKNDLIE